MGSWNGTCGLSQMPIKSGDRIKVVVIQNNYRPGNASGFCYETGMAKPISFIFNGKYNDYGMIEDIEDSPANTLFVDFFTNKLKESAIKIGDRADCEPNSLINILELIEREQISMRVDYWDEDTERMQRGFSELGIMMFHSSVVEDLTNTLYEDTGYWLKDYTEDNLTKMAIEVLKKDNKEEYKLLIRSLNKELREETDPGEKILIEKEIDEAYEKMFACKDLRENYENKFRSLVHSEIGNSIVFTMMIDKMKKFSTKDKAKSLNTLIDMLNLMQSMSSLRKYWGPQSGKGSQSEEYSFYRTLATSMLKIMDKDFEEQYDGQEVECLKSFKSFKKGKYYIVESLGGGEVYMKDEPPIITYIELENNFEY